MDAGTIVAIAAVAVTILGGAWKWVAGRIKDLRAEIEKLETESKLAVEKVKADAKVAVDKLETAAEADEKTIGILQRQVDKYEITAQIQDKFFSGLTERRERRGDSG